MAMEVKTNKPHAIELSGRKKATITGVTEVVGIQDSAITLNTTEGGLSLSGKGIRVAKFNREEGFLVLDGEFSQLKYSGGEAQGGFFKRLLK